jgi:hypothetical protein
MTGENIPAIGSINIGCAQHLTSSFIDSPESERDLRVTWISLGPIRLGYDALDQARCIPRSLAGARACLVRTSDLAMPADEPIRF